ncbi:unnamed protein product [Amoebophrya sp. A120]|nr:unnamed protein product [Amoebophrya sp. A120]|eukprot:GSA120T00005360001.1
MQTVQRRWVDSDGQVHGKQPTVGDAAPNFFAAQPPQPPSYNRRPFQQLLPDESPIAGLGVINVSQTPSDSELNLSVSFAAPASATRDYRYGGAVPAGPVSHDRNVNANPAADDDDEDVSFISSMCGGDGGVKHVVSGTTAGTAAGFCLNQNPGERPGEERLSVSAKKCFSRQNHDAKHHPEITPFQQTRRTGNTSDQVRFASSNWAEDSELLIPLENETFMVVDDANASQISYQYNMHDEKENYIQSPRSNRNMESVLVHSSLFEPSEILDQSDLRVRTGDDLRGCSSSCRKQQNKMQEKFFDSEMEMQENCDDVRFSVPPASSTMNPEDQYRRATFTTVASTSRQMSRTSSAVSQAEQARFAMFQEHQDVEVDHSVLQQQEQSSIISPMSVVKKSRAARPQGTPRRVGAGAGRSVVGDDPIKQQSQTPRFRVPEKIDLHLNESHLVQMEVSQCSISPMSIANGGNKRKEQPDTSPPSVGNCVAVKNRPPRLELGGASEQLQQRIAPQQQTGGVPEVFGVPSLDRTGPVPSFAVVGHVVAHQTNRRSTIHSGVGIHDRSERLGSRGRVPLQVEQQVQSNPFTQRPPSGSPLNALSRSKSSIFQPPPSCTNRSGVLLEHGMTRNSSQSQLSAGIKTAADNSCLRGCGPNWSAGSVPESALSRGVSVGLERRRSSSQQRRSNPYAPPSRGASPAGAVSVVDRRGSGIGAVPRPPTAQPCPQTRRVSDFNQDRRSPASSPNANKDPHQGGARQQDFGNRQRLSLPSGPSPSSSRTTPGPVSSGRTGAQVVPKAKPPSAGPASAKRASLSGKKKPNPFLAGPTRPSYSQGDAEQLQKNSSTAHLAPAQPSSAIPTPLFITAASAAAPPPVQSAATIQRPHVPMFTRQAPTRQAVKEMFNQAGGVSYSASSTEDQPSSSSKNKATKDTKQPATIISPPLHLTDQRVDLDGDSSLLNLSMASSVFHPRKWRNRN